MGVSLNAFTDLLIVFGWLIALTALLTALLGLCFVVWRITGELERWRT